jgi:squalene-hopene/tetraprenyl-beta-curcumene cyclase
MSQSLRHRTRETLDRLRRELLEQRTDDGHWVGQLSPSSLSTATAVSAMAALLIHGHGRKCDDDQLRDRIRRGIQYIGKQQNSDGGFGDTDRSRSNIATSYLVLAASTLASQASGQSLLPAQIEHLKIYIEAAGSIDGLRKRYGKDKTFVIPILTNMAIAGLISWDEVSALPFEAAAFPQSMYRLLQMPVVSYAIPALVAIGQTRHFHGRKALWPLRLMRAASIGRTMRVLREMQPASGGYLEAAPLTSFVVMSLAVTQRGDHEVSQSGLRFLVDTMNPDGSWPIDTNLATWVTSLSIHALACDPDDDGSWCTESLVRWHLSCQHRERHAFTGAEPGGWGWSDLSGAVPDSDDTPAAILALRQAQRWVGEELKSQCDRAIDEGIHWLQKLQNRDGGWPTFCRGWGKLPFDRSSTDLTAHALRATIAAGSRSQSQRTQEPHHAVHHDKAVQFLHKNQQPDGSWLPLWFGNQDHADESNPIYGSSRVLVAGALGVISQDAVNRGCEHLIESQNGDGGWGGGPSLVKWLKSHAPADSQLSSSVEETALAVDALSTVLLSRRNLGDDCGVQSGCIAQESRQDGSKSSSTGVAGGNQAYCEAIIRGVEFLLGSVDDGRHRVPWPIGFYFAKLWYHEKLYPLIFATTALGKYLRATAEDFDPNWPR